MTRCSSTTKLWISAFLAFLLSLPVFAIEKLKALPLLQLGSGLRVVGIGHRGTEMIGSYLLLRNRSEKRIVGFEIVFTAGIDERMDPGMKGDPEIIKRSGYFSVVLNPGDEYELFEQGPNFKDVISLLKNRNAHFGLLRVGVSRVVYADQTEQKFDVLKDEGTRRSEPPVDTGGTAATNPSKRPARNERTAQLATASVSKRSAAERPSRNETPARMKMASFSKESTAETQACPALGALLPSGQIGRLISARSLKSALPLSCNYEDCIFTCLDPPACTYWTSLCTPDGAWDCTSRCWTVSCIQ